METAHNHNMFKIAERLAEINFNKNGLALIDVAGKTITLARHNDQIFACAHKCPHAGGILADGYLDALGNIVCPLHRYKFNPKNGRNVSGEGYFLKTFEVQLTDDGVYVQISNR